VIDPTSGLATDRSNGNRQRPLDGILVLDFSQFLSGSLATLRLADMGARVIKIERPGTGDLGRTIYLSDTDVHGENTLFHAINRNKQSYAADLKNRSDLDKLRQLIARADVMVQNFRPGVMERLGFGYDRVRNRIGIWKCRSLARSTGTGSAGAGTVRDHVAERRRWRPSDAHGAGHRRYAGGT